MHTEGFDEALGASYRLVEQLGRGATGEVWKAVDRRTDEVVAAKLLRPEHTADQDLVGRFVRERSILTGVRHPNVVAVRDLVVEGDRLAIIMDFVAGGSLGEVLRESGPMPPDRAVVVAAAVLEGLAAAHAQGILHRDIKPDNVLLSETWEDLGAGDVKLTDFGISRLVADRSGTTTGLLGTPEFMAPELLVTGTCELSADVYGIGILLYELLAGRTPFAGPGTDYTVAHRHVASVPPQLPVAEELWSELARLLAKDPTTRPPAAEAATALRRLVPALDGLPALERQAPPAEFDSARGPATVVRGVAPDAGPAAAPAGADEDELPAAPADLGTSDQGTVLRPITAPRVRERPVRTHVAETRPKRPTWRDPRVIALVVAGVVLLGGAVAYATTTGAGTPSEPGQPVSDNPVRATSQGSPALTGLTVDRAAVYDPQNGSVELSITYRAQNSPLGGPFLEVIPGAGGACPPDVTWEGATAEPNIPTVSDIHVDCGWSVDPGEVPRQGAVTVTAQVPLELEGSDPSGALQEWLDAEAGATESAVTDAEFSSTAYPVQRLQGIQVVVPSRTTSSTTLEISVIPVWPNGEDRFNPVFVSPPRPGEPSSMLTAVAGGEEGVRFSDGCGGALTVTNGGLVVIASNLASDCTVITTVGNITDVESNSFDIASRGG